LMTQSGFGQKHYGRSISSELKAVDKTVKPTHLQSSCASNDLYACYMATWAT